MQSPDKETATVLKTEGKSATVITNKSASCKECGKAQAGICGKKGSGMVLRVNNTIGARQGDTVELGLSRKTHIEGLFVIFILPMLALIGFTYIGHLLSHYVEVRGLDSMSGITGLIISIIYSYKKIRKLDQRTELHIKKIFQDQTEYEIGSSSEEIDYFRAFHKS